MKFSPLCGQDPQGGAGAGGRPVVGADSLPLRGRQLPQGRLLETPLLAPRRLGLDLWAPVMGANLTGECEDIGFDIAST